MAIDLADVLEKASAAWRYAATKKRIRGLRGGALVVDSTAARLVWRPGNVVPHYAFLETELKVAVAEGVRPDDTDLAGWVVVPFKACDKWLEEEQEVRGHARDPYHRVDTRRSARRVVVEVAGEVIAESTRPTLVFETKLPMRVYIPREDIRMNRLRPSRTRTICAYKGDATYFSSGAIDDVAWTYEAPVHDATDIAGLVSFYPDRAIVTLDGQPL